VVGGLNVAAQVEKSKFLLESNSSHFQALEPGAFKTAICRSQLAPPDLE
jgi:hypothetical protein